MSIFEARRRSIKPSFPVEPDGVADTLAQSLQYAQLAVIEKRRSILAEGVRKSRKNKKKPLPKVTSISELAGATVIGHPAKARRNAKFDKARQIKRSPLVIDFQYSGAYRAKEKAVVLARKEKHSKTETNLPVVHGLVNQCGVDDMNSINAGNMMPQFAPDRDDANDAEHIVNVDSGSTAEQVAQSQKNDDLTSFTNSFFATNDLTQLDDVSRNETVVEEGEEPCLSQCDDADLAQDDGAEDDNNSAFQHKPAGHQPRRHRPLNQNSAPKRSGPLFPDAKILREEFLEQENKNEQEPNRHGAGEYAGTPNIGMRHDEDSVSDNENPVNPFEELTSGSKMFEEGKCGMPGCQEKGVHWHDEALAKLDESECDEWADIAMGAPIPMLVEPPFIEGYGDRSYNMALMLAPGIPTLRSPKLKASPAVPALRPTSRAECEQRCGRDGFCDPLSEFGCGGEYCVKPHRET